MPGKVKVRIVAGRNLPVMDRSSDTSDAYVEIKLGNTTFKTDVYRRSLNPHWNSEWFKFEADDEELQDEPLQIRVMDYDTYSANDAIGKVYIDLNPLLLSRDSGSMMSGWIPIYDTMHGIRGEVNVIVKVDFFSDCNRFKVSSCGVQFFCTPSVPHGYRAQTIHGFVEELVVNDDPEYHWIDKIRTPRASNEARQTLFSKLSGEVQRKIGLKTLELGGNAVVGYRQCFDLEGESGIVARGIGTAITICRFQEAFHNSPPPVRDNTRDSPLPEEGLQLSSSPATPTPPKLSQSPAKCASFLPNLQWRLSESDLSITPKGEGGRGGSGSCQTGSGGNVAVGTATKTTSQRTFLAHDAVDMLEYPFLSMTQFPPGLILHLGGVVSARSVKLLCRINNPVDDPETRDTWWTELRMEIRAHARALGCNVVLGYYETTSFCDDICLLSASGTGAIVKWHSDTAKCTIVEERDKEAEKLTNHCSGMTKDLGNTPMTESKVSGGGHILRVRQHGEASLDHSSSAVNCSLCHIPYSESSVPFPVALVRCAICKKYRVPDVLFTTVQPPYGIPMAGRGCLVQARVCRAKKDGKGEVNAKEISDSLPFLEYELHKQLLNKCKIKGMNSLFGLRIQVSVGIRIIVAVATATGVYLSALPPPAPLKIASGKNTDDLRVAEMQQRVCDTLNKNRELYDILMPTQDLSGERHFNGNVGETEDSDEDLPELDFSLGNKDACILEIDDMEDVDFIHLLLDRRPPDGFGYCNTVSLPGMDSTTCNLQMFFRVWRSKLPSGGLSNRQLSFYFEEIIQNLFFKLRKMVPCVLCNLRFIVDLPEDDELQISVLGMALGIGEYHGLITSAIAHAPWSTSRSGQESDRDYELIFNMEEDQGSDSLEHRRDSLSQDCRRSGKQDDYRRGRLDDATKKGRSSKETPAKYNLEKKFSYHTPNKDRINIELTPLPYIPGAKIDAYLGNLNFFFIRESTAIREAGGLSGFIHGFITETLAIVRAHVAALGGNALVSFFISECVLLHNPHKNQGQCLINVGGDIVQTLNTVPLQPAPTTDSGHVKKTPIQTMPNDEVDRTTWKPQSRGSPKEHKPLTVTLGH